MFFINLMISTYMKIISIIFVYRTSEMFRYAKYEIHVRLFLLSIKQLYSIVYPAILYA